MLEVRYCQTVYLLHGVRSVILSASISVTWSQKCHTVSQYICYMLLEVRYCQSVYLLHGVRNVILSAGISATWCQKCHTVSSISSTWCQKWDTVNQYIIYIVSEVRYCKSVYLLHGVRSAILSISISAT